MFAENVTDIKNYLDENDFKKSKTYLDNLLQKKNNWDKSQLNNIFNAEITTTSRA